VPLVGFDGGNSTEASTAEAEAAIPSLIETCKLTGVKPERHLADLLTRIVDGWPKSRIDELIP
jgi:hypothetical protein